MQSNTNKSNSRLRRGNNDKKKKLVVKPTALELFIQELNRSSIPKSMRGGNVVPLHQPRIHHFTVDITLMGASTFLVAAFKANDLYSPNVTYIPAGTVPDFQRESLAYNQAKVYSITPRVTLENHEPAIPLNCFIGYSDEQPAPTTYTQAKNLRNRPVASKIYSVGQTTGMAKIVIPPITIGLGDVIGNNPLYFTYPAYDTTAGAVPASPTQLVYFYFVLLSPTLTNMANGGVVTLEMAYHTLWYSPRNEID